MNKNLYQSIKYNAFLSKDPFNYLFCCACYFRCLNDVKNDHFFVHALGVWVFHENSLATSPQWLVRADLQGD